MSCRNNFKQIGLAIHNYHCAYNQLPMQGTGTNGRSNFPSNTNWAGDPNPEFTNAYLPWQTELSGFCCPSDPGTGLPAQCRTNYAACHGDSNFRYESTGLNLNGSVNVNNARTQRGKYIITIISA